MSESGLTRRDALKALSAAGIAASTVTLGGCDDEGIAGLPADLPNYTFAGTPGPETLFQHGVASGDPLTTAVIIWTRVTPAAEGAVQVFYEVAVDEAFTNRVAAGTVSTDAEVDYTVKVDVTGLVFGRDYYYRFFAEGRESVTGRTRTAPAAGEATSLRVGLASCASYAHGMFHAYRWLAAQPDIDVVLHLGDYIYEYGSGSYGNERDYEPAHEIVDLADYRQRYAQYRRDPDLQLVHQRAPMIVIWDDHETANNSYRDGAENHDPDEGEGEWTERVAIAKQAYFEWLPIRGDAAETPIYRRFDYGDLLDIIMLDTRIEGRDEPPADADEAAGKDILGATQEAWLAERLKASTATWRILGQQVVMAHSYISGDGPFNFDQWDGYPDSRSRVFDMFEADAADTIVVTGDIHSSWANELARDPFASTYNRASDNLGVEVVCTAVSSPALPGPAGKSFGEQMAEDNPHILWSDFDKRGYVVLDINSERVQADWFHVEGVKEDQGEEMFAKGFSVARGSHMWSEAAEPALPFDTEGE